MAILKFRTPPLGSNGRPHKQTMFSIWWGKLDG